jgi:hypothetical protein
VRYAEYVLSGWGISLAAVGFYGWRLVRRGKRLSAAVDPARRRWLTTEESAGG